MMVRRCSSCRSIGHTAPSCGLRNMDGDSGEVRLFGVKLRGERERERSGSMGSLSVGSDLVEVEEYHSDYVSDGSAPRHHRNNIRKKGIIWTADEHRQFLVGLETLGKGDWRGISRNYVVTRTPSQVASHAQKYFLHLGLTRKKRRASLFDMVPGMETNPPAPEDPEAMPFSSQEVDKDTSLRSYSLELSLRPALEPFPFRLAPPNEHPLEDDEAETACKRPRTEERVKGKASLCQLTLGGTSTAVDPSALSLTIPGMSN